MYAVFIVSSGPYFRNDKVAAPLKRDLAGLLYSSAVNFRNDKVAAPLKHLQELREATTIADHFRNDKVAAPLKQALYANEGCAGDKFPQR